MQVHVVARVTIGASPSAVFKYLAHLKYHFLWNPPLQSVSPQTRLKLGMEYRSSSLLLGIKVNAVNVVRTFVANQEMELQNDSGPLKYRVNYFLKPQAAGTVLICTTTVSSTSRAFTFTAPVLKLLARRELQADLQALKIAVEHKLT